jgi:acyl-CoA synthetase (NDP forming)
MAMLNSRDRVRVYPVNPNYDKLGGLRGYASVEDLREGRDLAGIVVPHSGGVSALVILSEAKGGGGWSASE